MYLPWYLRQVTRVFVCLFSHLLSCFHADLAGQPSEMVLIHHYLFVGGVSVKDIAVGSKPAPLKCKCVDNICEVFLQNLLWF